MNKTYKSAKDKLKGVRHMMKNIAWNVFKNTGNINTFLELKQLENIENNNSVNENNFSSVIQKVELNGNDKNQWNNNF